MNHRQKLVELRDKYARLSANHKGPYRNTFADMRDDIDAILADWHPEAKVEEGDVVVTTNDKGEAVAVTRQDDWGRIISVIWEKEDER